VYRDTVAPCVAQGDLRRLSGASPFPSDLEPERAWLATPDPIT
jgi:hypothetical protein